MSEVYSKVLSLVLILNVLGFPIIGNSTIVSKEAKVQQTKTSIHISENTNITIVRDICFADDENIYIIGFNRETPQNENGEFKNILARYNTTDGSMKVMDTWWGTSDHILRGVKPKDGDTILFTGVLIYRISPQNQILKRQVLPQYQHREPFISFNLGKIVYVHNDNLNLYSYDFNTKQEKLLYDCSKLGDPNYYVLNPTLNEDGKYVFFQVCNCEPMSIQHMCILNLETGELSQIDFEKLFIFGETQNLWIDNSPALLSFKEGKNTSIIFTFDTKGNLHKSIDYYYTIHSMKSKDNRDNRILCCLDKGSYDYNLLGALNPKTLELKIIHKSVDYINEYDIAPSGDKVAWTQGDNLVWKKIED